MTYQSGKAVATYELDISQAKRAAAELRALFQSIQQQSASLGRAAATAGSGGQQAAGLSQQSAAARRAVADFERLDRQYNAVRDSEIRAARATGDHARELQLIERQLQAASQGTVRYNNLLGQQARASQQAAKAAQQEQDALRNSIKPQQGGGAASAVSGLQAGLGAAGLAVGAGQLAGFAIAAGRSSLELDRTLRLTRELTGSQDVYNNVIAAARHQQELYGGSLQENIAGIQGLVVTSRSTGAELSTLINLAQRLAVLDPAQGTEGARIALQEVLSGDPRSLARRYEIPLAALQKIKDESIPVADRLLILDQYLNKIGITSEVAEKSISADARSFNALAIASENARLKLGGFLSRGAAPTAQAAADALNIFSGGREALASGVQGLSALAQNLIGLPPPLASAAQANRDFGASILGWLGFASSAPPAIGAMASAVVAAADTMESARARERAATNAARDSMEAYRAIEAQHVALAPQIAAAQLGYANALEMSGVQARAGALATQQKSDADKLAAVDAQTHGLAEEKLARQAQFAAEALLRAGPAGARTAALLASSSQQIDVMTAAFYRLAAAKQAAIATNPLEGITEDRSERQGTGGSNDTRVALAEKAAAIEQARLQQTIQTGTATQKTAALQQQYNNAVRQFGKNSKEAISAQTSLIQAQQAAGKTRVSAAQSTALQLNNVEENAQLQLLRTLREGQERLRDQEQDFDLRRTRSKEDFEEKRRSLLARGRRAEAAALTKEFEKDQRRAKEDFDIDKRRTLRNNQEGVGDLGDKTDLRTAQIGARAALRGVVPAGGAIIPPAALAGAQALPQALTDTPRAIAQLTISGVVNLDGKAVGTGVWPTIELLVDNELSASLNILNAPGSGQSAIAGVG